VAIQKVADRFGLRVLADAAQSFGANVDGSPVGSLAEATATSFFPAKPLGCYGDGGAVFTDDAGLGAVMRSLRIHGKGADKYDTVRIGMNSRLDTVQAAVLLAKLTVLDAEISMRQDVANRYAGALEESEHIDVPPKTPSAWAQYTIRLRHPTLTRKAIMHRLGDAGVPTAVYYPRALHEQPVFRDLALGRGTAPTVSSKLSDVVLSLPMHPYLSEAAQEGVVVCVVRELEGA